MRFLVLLFSVLCSLTARAQAVSRLVQPAYLGLTAYHSRFADPFAMQVNAASLARVDTLLASVNAERKFLLADLDYFYGAIAFPVLSGGVGISVACNGTKGFSHTRLGALYGKKLSEKTALGVEFNYERISIQGYGSVGTVNFSIAFQYLVSKDITVGFSVENPVGGRLGATGEKLASGYAGGIGNRLSEKVFLGLAITKEEESAARLFMQLQYDATKVFRLLGGLSLNSGEAFTGYSVSIGSMEISQCFTWHQSIGISPALSLMFHFNRRE